MVLGIQCITARIDGNFMLGVQIRAEWTACRSVSDEKIVLAA
jgi:hypothetical protein